MTEHRSRRLAAALLALLAANSTGLFAQAGVSLLEDVSMTPRGLFRLRTPVVSTRYETRFSSSGVTPLGALFIKDSLGVSTLTRLDFAQKAIEGAAGSAFTLSLGKSRLNAVAREEHVPLTLEYGLHRRLSVSVMMPVVRKRVIGFLSLDSLGANVGPNPNRLNATVRASNQQVYTEFAAAVSQLQARLAACTASPSSAGCPAFLARQNEVQPLIQASESFSRNVGDVYGGSSSSGEPFVPRAGSSAQAAIASRVATFNSLYKDLLAVSTDLLTAVPSAAAGPAGSADIINYLREQTGDSLTNQEVLGVGDVELGVKYLMLDKASSDGNLGARLAVAASYRFASGTRQDPVGVAELRVGDGRGAVSMRMLGEVSFRRLAVLGTASFESLVLPVAVPLLPYRPAVDGYTERPPTGRWSAAVEPRWHLTDALAFHGSYWAGAPNGEGNMQAVGGGARFTTVSRYQSGARPLPMEMRFSHLQAVRGDAGAPKFTRDQLEVRVYYQRRAR